MIYVTSDLHCCSLETLQKLLDLVLDETLPNEKNALLEAAADL